MRPIGARPHVDGEPSDRESAPPARRLVPRQRGVEHLIAHGHRRIALLADVLTIATARERSAGYEAALTAAGIELDSQLGRTGLQDAVAAESAVRELFALPHPPTAIFTGNNRLSVGAVRALARRSDVALVGFDDTEFAAVLDPPLSVIAYDAVELGRRAAQMLWQRLSGNTAPARRVVLPTRLIARGSGEISPPNSPISLR